MQWIRPDEESSFFRPDHPLKCPLIGGEVPVLIYTDGEVIQPDQLQALSRFLGIPAEARADLIGPLFNDYREVYKAVGEGPEIDGADQVWEFVRWTTLLIPLQGPSGSRFVFLKGDPAWEEEHGVELLFRDERLVDLDRASGAFLTSLFWSRT